MSAIQPPAKLIKQIREALTARGANAPVETLAAEYARLAEEATLRLDSCAAMIAKGSEYQALQLAETEPVLLDLLALLSFAESREWAAFCLAHHLPVAPRFEARAVRALDDLYAKGIDGNHPLYRDYRAAVNSRDDGRAIQIVRSIVRLNAQDANARAELARLENKLFQVRLQSLRAALAGREESAILAELAELERLATPAKLAECPEFAQAAEVRRLAARTGAMALAERLAASLPGEREAGAWRMVGEMLARIQVLQAEHGFSLTPESGAVVDAMRPYVETERAAAAETAHFQESMRTVTALAEQIETRRSLTLPETRELAADFDKRWREVEQFGRAVPDELTSRVLTTAATLHGEAVRLERQRRLKLSVSVAAALVIVGIAAWFAARTWRVHNYARELAALQTSGQVESAETMAAHLRTKSAGLASQPALRERLGAVEAWTRDERGKLASVEKRLEELEKISAGNFGGAEPVAVQAQLEMARQLANELASGVRAIPVSRIAAVRNRFDVFLASAREKLATQSEQELSALEAIAGAKLSYDQPKDALLAALEQIGPPLKVLETRARSPLPALALPPPLQERTMALRQRADLFEGELGLLQKLNAEMLQATTLDAYRKALGGFQDSHLTQVAEVNAARKTIAAFPEPDDILAALLLPGNPAGWTAAKADQSGELLAPTTVEATEIGRLVSLRDDIYLNDIWEVTLVDYARKSERRTVLARGELRKDGPRESGLAQVTAWSGAVFDPTIKADIPAFRATTFTSQRTDRGFAGSGEIGESHRSAVSECVARLELNRMTDATGEKFERPLLRVFDELVRDKAASPIFKAFLMQQLAAILRERPFAWGLEYCPRLSRDLARLDELCGGETLRSMDWLLERKRAQFGATLAPFFSELQSRSYLADARLHRDTVRAALKAGLQFGGFFDGRGRPNLREEPAPDAVLWALSSEGGRVVRCDVPTDAGSDKCAKFSPIFFVPVDRQALLAAAGRKIAVPPGTKLSLPEIPFFDAQ